MKVDLAICSLPIYIYYAKCNYLPNFESLYLNYDVHLTFAILGPQVSSAVLYLTPWTGEKIMSDECIASLYTLSLL